jgi:hypothetical protein
MTTDAATSLVMKPKIIVSYREDMPCP